MSDVQRFLSHLATKGEVSASPRRQALYVLVIVYREIVAMSKDLQDELQRQVDAVKSIDHKA